MTAYGEETNAKPQPGVTVTKMEGAEPYALRSGIAKLLRSPAARAAIEPLLRPGDDFDTVLVETYHAAKQNPKILECDPVTIVSAVARAVQTRLVIGRTVYLVPFNQQKGPPRLECIIGYMGLIELVCSAGGARSIDAHCVYEHEVFSVEQGTAPQIKHLPIMDPAKRGKLIGAYAIAWVTSYRFLSVVLHEKEIDQIRQKYSKQWKGGEVPYWYAQKTCVIRIVKLLPKNPKLARALAVLEREDELERETEALVAGEVVQPDGPIHDVSQTPNGEDEPEWFRSAGEDDDDFNDLSALR